MASDRQYGQLLSPLLTRAGGYARSILRNRDDAADAVQQAALRGLERFHTFDLTRPFNGWWFAILRNCCIDLLRQSRAIRAESLDDVELVQPAASDTTDWERLSTAMNSLSEHHRDILHLRYFAELNYRELAESLCIPEGTVMSRLHLARKALQAKFSKREQP